MIPVVVEVMNIISQPSLNRVVVARRGLDQKYLHHLTCTQRLLEDNLAPLDKKGKNQYSEGLGVDARRSYMSDTKLLPMVPNFMPHRGGRVPQYRNYLRVLRSRLQFVEEKETEWKKQHPGEQPASYYKSERNTLKWVLELVTCAVPEEHRPPGAPIPVIADECPACRTPVSRLHTGLKRADPWKCSACGHQYPAPQEITATSEPLDQD